MMELFASDLNNSIEAIEYYITEWEQHLIKSNQGGTDGEWARIDGFKSTLNNLKLMRAIYG